MTLAATTPIHIQGTRMIGSTGNITSIIYITLKLNFNFET